ncbi:retrotransposable element Tf2 [Tanacetum coccineum]
MKRAQDRIKNLADKDRSDREFDVDTWVYLKLQPYRQVTVRQNKHHKLSPKYFGPFKIIQRVGKVSYKLQLPESSPVPSVLSYVYRLILEEPYDVLDRRMAKRGNAAAIYVLIQWVNGSPVDATWELYEDIA